MDDKKQAAAVLCSHGALVAGHVIGKCATKAEAVAFVTEGGHPSESVSIIDAPFPPFGGCSVVGCVGR